jgi:creatinine amidohydrolase
MGLLGGTMKHEWAKMTWKEIAAARERRPVVLVPIGTIETHGPHTFVGLEHVLAERLALDAARQMDSLVTPGIPFGYSELFRRFPGTITLEADVVEGIYEQVVRSVLRAGFDHVLLVANHIPNQPMIEHVAFRIRRDEGVLIAWTNPQTMAASFLKEIFSDPAAVRGHGAEPGSSLAAYLDREAFDPAGAGPLPAPSEFHRLKVQGTNPVVGGQIVGMALRMDDVAPSPGGWGDPSRASADAGRHIYGKLLEYLVTLIREFTGFDTRVDRGPA